MTAARLIALELVVGAALASGYLSMIRPYAPRAAAAAQKPSVPVVAAEATVVVPPTEVVAPPAPAVIPEPVEGPPPPARKSTPPPAVATVRTPLTPPPTPAVAVADLIRSGVSSLNAKQWPLALEAFEAAKRLEPTNPDLGYLRGMVLENLGQPGAAIDAYRTCTDGPYANIARTHVKSLATKLRAEK